MYKKDAGGREKNLHYNQQVEKFRLMGEKPAFCDISCGISVKKGGKP
jgi:hypothetical protein